MPTSGGNIHANALDRLAAAGFDELPDEPGDLPGDEPAPKPEPEQEGDEQELDAEPEPGAADDLVAGKGSREFPLKHRDLPDDKFVEVKTQDGSKVVVSLKEALAGAYMRPELFDRQMHQMKESVVRAKELGERALKNQEAFIEDARAVLADPRALFENLLETNEGVLAAIAQAYGRLLKRERENPQQRLDRIAEVNAKRNAAERERTARERKEWETTRANREAVDARKRELQPVYEEALKEAGFPKETEEFKEELSVRHELARRRYGKLSREQFKAVVLAAAKAAAPNGKPAPKRPAAAPRAASPAARGAAPREAQVDWSKVPREERMRDPRYLFGPKSQRVS
jgi:hypothetical protein